MPARRPTRRMQISYHTVRYCSNERSRASTSSIAVATNESSVESKWALCPKDAQRNSSCAAATCPSSSSNSSSTTTGWIQSNDGRVRGKELEEQALEQHETTIQTSESGRQSQRWNCIASTVVGQSSVHTAYRTVQSVD